MALCHRVRLAMTKEPLLTKLGVGGGIVELDETFIGGKKGNKGKAADVSQSNEGDYGRIINGRGGRTGGTVGLPKSRRLKSLTT